MECIMNKINCVSERDRCLISGFVKNCQSLFPKNNPYFIIPSLVIYVILYFYSELEEFDDHPTGIVLTGDNKIATTATPHWSSLYGKNIYQRNKRLIYHWTFKIVDGPLVGDILIGIHSYDTFGKILDGDFTSSSRHEMAKSLYWAICCNGMIYSNTNDNEFKYGGKYGENARWRLGDEIEMILDMKQKTLTFYVNDRDQGIAFDDITCDNYIHTYMAVSMGSIRTVVQLISFNMS